MRESRCVSITIPAIWAGLAWTISLPLTIFVELTGRLTTHGLWCVLGLAIAVTLTVVSALCESRRKTVEAVVRKITLLDEASRLTKI